MMAKEKEEGRMAVLRELGVEDAKTAKDGLSKYQEHLDSKKTDLEKAQGETAKEKTAREKAELEAALLRRKLDIVKAGVRPEAIDDVAALVAARLVDGKTEEAVLKELKAAYPSFFVEGGESGEAGKGTGKNPSSKKSPGTPQGLGSRLAATKARPASKSSYFQK